MSIPENLKYDKSHIWLKFEEEFITMGITEFAQKIFGLLTSIAFHEINEDFSALGYIFEIESDKAKVAYFSPIPGKIIEINNELLYRPNLVNDSPYNDGWLLKIKSDINQNNNFWVENLFTPQQYEKLIVELQSKTELFPLHGKYNKLQISLVEAFPFHEEVDTIIVKAHIGYTMFGNICNFLEHFLKEDQLVVRLQNYASEINRSRRQKVRLVKCDFGNKSNIKNIVLYPSAVRQVFHFRFPDVIEYWNLIPKNWHYRNIWMSLILAARYRNAENIIFIPEERKEQVFCIGEALGHFVDSEPSNLKNIYFHAPTGLIEAIEKIPQVLNPEGHLQHRPMQVSIEENDDFIDIVKVNHGGIEV